MCPVQALHYYLQCMQPICGNTALFVHWDEDRAQSTAFLVHSLRQCVQPIPAWVGQMRFSVRILILSGASVMTSWAKIAKSTGVILKMDPEEIWSLGSIFHGGPFTI